jgi:hypothetical protein
LLSKGHLQQALLSFGLVPGQIPDLNRSGLV